MTRIYYCCVSLALSVDDWNERVEEEEKAEGEVKKRRLRSEVSRVGDAQ